MYEITRLMLQFLWEPLPLVWRVIRNPLSFHRLIGQTGITEILGLLAWSTALAVYSAELLQPNFDLYYFGERDAAIDRLPSFPIHAPFAKEIANVLGWVVALITLLPMAWVFHGSLREAFLDSRVPKLWLLFSALTTLIDAIIRMVSGWSMARYSDEFLSEYLLADVYVLFAIGVSLATMAPWFLLNLKRLFPAISIGWFFSGLVLSFLTFLAVYGALGWLLFSFFGEVLFEIMDQAYR